MLLKESENVELKQMVVDDIKKEVLAFANTGGGTLYIYVRHGTSSVPATDTAIRKMIRETDGDIFEKLRSTKQELTFASAEVEFARRSVPFGTVQMTTLGLANTDHIYTNLGLILSDQCPHSIKAAVFQDTTQQTFQDRREFSGSLFKQINDVYGYLDLHNQTESTFDKLLRIDKRDYPEPALREALLNAVVHREYATGGSILVKMFSDRIEFISPGGLVSGIELGDIMSGYSACRNPALASVLYRLQLIEAYGTGVLKIYECYNNSLHQPKIEVTPNVFKIILPNLNTQRNRSNAPLTPQELVILNYIREHDSIDRKQTEQLLGISQTSAGVVLRKMVNAGILSKSGNSRNVRYFVSK